jgi:SseB protein N-terminal domain
VSAPGPDETAAPGRALPWDGPRRPLPGGVPDDGAVDPRLAVALASHDGTPAARAEVLAALAGARVFVAVRATATSEQTAPVTGLRQESTAELALLCLRSAAGALAVPVFSDGHAVQTWQPDARPVPLRGPDACGAARDQGADVLLVDPAGAAFAADADELRALADGYVPVTGSAGLQVRRGEAALRTPDAPVPPALVAALGEALRDEPVTSARLLQGPDGLVLGLVGPGLDPPALAALAGRLLERTRAVLPPDGLDVARVGEGKAAGVPLVPARRRGLLRRRR